MGKCGYSGLAGFLCDQAETDVDSVVGESVVCLGEEPAALAWLPDPSQPLRARSSYHASADTIDHLEGRDFVVDDEQGTLRRTPGSRIPDFRTNMLFGKEDFDHNRFALVNRR